MNDSEKIIEQILDFLREAVTKQYNIIEAQQELNRKCTSLPFTDVPIPSLSKILLSSAWTLTRENYDSYQISASLRHLWNHFVCKILSPDGIYGYLTESDFRADLEQLYAGFSSVAENRAGIPASKKYHLYGKTSGVSGYFVGREALLHEIHRRLNFETPQLILYGLGGIGKSELARAYADRYASFYHTIVFCRFQKNLQETLIDDYQISIDHLTFRGTGKRGERGWYFRRKMDILKDIVDEHTLLIIDNFDVLADERLTALTTLPCKLLFTSRTDAAVFSMPGLRIPPLSREDQRKLFFAYYKKELAPTELPQLDRLLAFLNGHTLSIKLCALHLEETGKSIAELQEELLAEQASKENEIQKNVRSIFRISTLTRQEKEILRFLSVMPLYGISLEKFLEWCHIEDQQPIQKLINRGLVEWNEQNQQLSLHPLIMHAVRQTEHVSFRNCCPYTKTLCVFSDQLWGKSVAEMQEYEKYIYTLVAVLKNTEKEPFADLTHLISALWQLGYYSEAVSFGMNMYQYCQENYADDSTEAARLRYRIGEAYDNWGKTDLAIKWFCLAYENYMKCKEPHPFFHALICHKYGKALLYEKNWEESERIMLYAQDYLKREIQNNPKAVKVGYAQNLVPGSLMDIYMELAILYLEWGKPETALVWLKRREKEFHEFHLDMSRPTSQWHLYYVLGLCHMKLGNLKDAEESLHRSLSYTRKYFIKNSPFTCMVLDAFGKLMLQKGDAEAAEEWFRQKKILEKGTQT